MQQIFISSGDLKPSPILECRENHHYLATPFGTWFPSRRPATAWDCVYADISAVPAWRSQVINPTQDWPTLPSERFPEGSLFRLLHHLPPPPSCSPPHVRQTARTPASAKAHLPGQTNIQTNVLRDGATGYSLNIIRPPTETILATPMKRQKPHSSVKIRHPFLIQAYLLQESFGWQTTMPGGGTSINAESA